VSKNSETPKRLPLQIATREIGLTGHGLLKLLQRINGAVRDDGHWYVPSETLASVKAARHALGIARAPKRKILPRRVDEALKGVADDLSN
jgi:hypothetical protein